MADDFMMRGDRMKDGAAKEDQLLIGDETANTFYFGKNDNGNDSIQNFGKNDILVYDEKLFDSNNDGIVTFGRNGVLDSDGPDANEDTVKIEGFNGKVGVRYLGASDEGLHVYADASVRLKGFTEGTLADNVFNRDAGDARTDRYFYDTNLDLSLGSDTINNFGAKDLLVTTSAIYDSNGDGIIEFAANGLLDLPAGEAQKTDPNNGPGGQLKITGTTALEFDGSTTVNGVTYYVYSLVGSSAGVDNLLG